MWVWGDHWLDRGCFVCFTITEGLKLAKGLNEWDGVEGKEMHIDVFYIINEEVITRPSWGWCLHEFCRRGHDYMYLFLWTSALAFVFFAFLASACCSGDESICDLFSVGFNCFIMRVCQRVSYRCYWHSVHLQRGYRSVLVAKMEVGILPTDLCWLLFVKPVWLSCEILVTAIVLLIVHWSEILKEDGNYIELKYYQHMLCHIITSLLPLWSF